MKLFLELADILRKEKELYDKLARLEDNKTKAIMKRNGKNLDEITRQEELLLKELSFLEEKRIELSKLSAQSSGLVIRNSEITISALARHIKGEVAGLIMAAGIALKRAALKVQKTKELNEKLMKDNLDFFQIVFTGLKSASSINTGYTQDGKENVMSMGSLLFNKTA